LSDSTLTSVFAVGSRHPIPQFNLPQFVQDRVKRKLVQDYFFDRFAGLKRARHGLDDRAALRLGADWLDGDYPTAFAAPIDR